MERPQEEPIDSSVLYVIILNTLAIMVTLIQPVGPINNKEINLKTMCLFVIYATVSEYPHLSKMASSFPKFY